MLEAGAKGVLGVDTGRDQFDSELSDDPRMMVRESTNVKDLTPGEVREVLGGLPQLVAIDVSFVGLAHIFPAVADLTEPGTPVVALVKPQFEVGRENLSRAGIVRDPAVRAKALEDVKAAAGESGGDWGGPQRHWRHREYARPPWGQTKIGRHRGHILG